MSALVVRDLYKAYDGRVILDNIDLKVAGGELCIVLGPSGCGKSTLLRLILGQERPTSGEIFLDGEPLGYADARRGIVYQRYSLYPHLTVLENVLLGPRHAARNWRAERDAAREEAVRFLNRVRLGDALDKYPHQLSGGMQQRVAIVQAFITRPRILLMDEPFGALDPATREELQLFLLELWEETKMTVFFVTHSVEEGLFLGTRLMLLSQYYTDDRNAQGTKAHGAKIVLDLALDPTLFRVSEKSSDAFIATRDEILRAGFDPAYLRHVDAFNLSHPHSFRTLSRAESASLGEA